MAEGKMYQASFAFRETVVHLVDELDGMYLTRSIILEGPDIEPLKVKLKEVGYRTPIRNIRELLNAIGMTIAYWNSFGLITSKVVRDIRYGERVHRKLKPEYDKIISTFNDASGKAYLFSEYVTVKKKRVNVKIPSKVGNKIAMSFIFLEGGKYDVNLTITDGIKTKHFLRSNWRLKNCNSLIKQWDDWVVKVNLDDPNTEVLLNSKSEIRNFLFDNKTMLTDLIADVNKVTK